jgi:hypothetical protein
MTRAELAAFFPANGTPLHTGAQSYAVPTLAWLRGPCFDAFRARYWQADLAKWQFRWECRDFAAAFRLFAVECWARTPALNSQLSAISSESDGIAVGELWFLPDPLNAAQGHAICPVICDQGLQFIEPQTGLLAPCSPAQLASRYFLRF